MKQTRYNVVTDTETLASNLTHKQAVRTAVALHNMGHDVRIERAR